MLADFNKFLEHQKPKVIKELRPVKRLREDRAHLKRPTPSDYEWKVEEVETVSKQGIVTIVQFAAWKGVHRNTVMAQYSEGKFKDVYQHILSVCEAYTEARLYETERNATGLIFAMKNSYGWVDKTETELSGNLDLPLSKEGQAILDKALNGGNEDVTAH